MATKSKKQAASKEAQPKKDQAKADSARKVIHLRRGA